MDIVLIGGTVLFGLMYFKTKQPVYAAVALLLGLLTVGIVVTLTRAMLP